MAIKINIDPAIASESQKTINVTIKGREKIDYNFDLHVRETLNGDFLIFYAHIVSSKRM